MVDENLLRQLENSLDLYQETQETLDVVVQNAQFLFGEEWLEKLPLAFDNQPMDTARKIVLKDKANHVVHYYGALAAWQEASTYLTDEKTATVDLLAERIPTLEYWLALFGNEGKDLVAQVKNLYQKLAQTDAHLAQEEEPAEIPEVIGTQELQQTAQQSVNPTVVEPVALPETPLQTNLPEHELPSLPEESEVLQTPPEQSEILPAQIASEEEMIVQVMPEIFKEPESLPEIAEKEELTQAQNNQPVLVEETLEEPKKEDIVLTEEKPVWQDKNTAGEMSLEELVDFSIPSSVSQIPTEEFIDAKEVMQGTTQMVTQNWDLANFLRQKRLYDDANNWLSAWCIRMNNSEKTDYPHYGFIVDIMYDLKEKIQIVLENQLLEELVEREIPGGQEAMNRLLEALDKELEDLPDDFKMPTAEKIKLSAREILGAMDESSEKEFIGPAPDGFELMDDPYAASTEQILSDFEKTEEEAQNQIDKLNVIEENENKTEKD